MAADSLAELPARGQIGSNGAVHAHVFRRQQLQRRDCGHRLGNAGGVGPRIQRHGGCRRIVRGTRLPICVAGHLQPVFDDDVAVSHGLLVDGAVDLLAPGRVHHAITVEARAREVLVDRGAAEAHGCGNNRGDERAGGCASGRYSISHGRNLLDVLPSRSLSATGLGNSVEIAPSSSSRRDARLTDWQIISLEIFKNHRAGGG